MVDSCLCLQSCFHQKVCPVFCLQNYFQARGRPDWRLGRCLLDCCREGWPRDCHRQACYLGFHRMQARKGDLGQPIKDMSQ